MLIKNFLHLLTFYVVGLALIFAEQCLAINSTEKRIPELLTIEYPLNGAMFPMEIAPSTFIWEDKSNLANSWLIQIGHEGEPILMETVVNQKKWKPGRTRWEKIKSAALEKPLTITITGVKINCSEYDEEAWVSHGEVTIRASSDPVDAPIFFREVPLPFDHANKYPEKIRYRLGYVSDEHEPQTLLENLPLCGNCHSFSKDGSVLGMDVDYANDKGSYVLTELEQITDLTPDKIITWSDYKREDKTLTFGLLSSVSPSGKHAVSTVKDRSIFVGLPENMAYSQLFFPIEGILASYDRESESYRSIKGADNPEFVQSNPSWSPDGETLFFARAKAHQLKSEDSYAGVIIPKEAAAEFLEDNKQFKYDIYKVPFNNGEGGEAVPLKGASKNGKSNYFPKVTPDGKWVVFTQADNFMLLQPDSRLYIVPAEGGEVREMNCNTDAMNSWHSFSPSGRWMVFSSKARGIYTQLWLTHLDENGNDTSPVLLEHLMSDKRAANIPEFLNIEPGSVEKLVDQFSEGGNYHYRVAKNLIRYGDLEAALGVLNEAAKKQPDNPEVFLERGALHSKFNNKKLAIQDFVRVTEIAPDDFRGPFNLALALEFNGELENALIALNKAIDINSKNYHVIGKRALLKQKLGDQQGALNDFDSALALSPRSARLLNFRGDIKRELEDFVGAFQDFNKAISLKPDMGEAYLNRSYTYLSLNDLTNADNDLKKAREYVPNAPLAYIIDALISFKSTEPGRGCTALKEAIDQGHTGTYEGQIESLYGKVCRA